MEAYQVSQGWELIIKEKMRKINQGGFHGFSYQHKHFFDLCSTCSIYEW
jgi:hypothetical protein